MPPVVDEPQLSLKDDMSIIKDLQNTENLIPVTPVKQGLMPETNTETPALNSQPTTLNLQPSTTEGVNSQPSTLNLDNILGETTPPSAILKTEVPVQPSTTPIANNKLPITNTKLPITSSKNK